MKSLIIVGMPRSMSTLIYRYASYMLKDELKILDPEIWHDGDVLNHIQVEYPNIKKKFARSNYHQYQNSKSVLKKYSKDYLIKSVAQPLHAARFLNENEDYKVLVIKRNIADIVYTLYLREWFWPINILGIDSEKEENQTLENLCKATIKIQENVLGEIKNKELISYENLLFDEKLLWRKLKRLGYNPKFVSHIDDEFKKRREVILAIREAPLYKQILSMVNRT